MKPERWKEVERLYNAALELEPARRSDFLAEACAGDEPLRVEVEALLSHGEQARSFIEAPAMEMLARELAADSPPSKGDRLVDDPGEPTDGIKRHAQKRVPWWMIAIAAVFIIVNAVRYYAISISPEPAGWTVADVTDKAGSSIGLEILTVQPDSPAARAGLEPGDILLISNSGGLLRQPPYPLYYESGRTYRIEIQRKEEYKTLLLRFGRFRWSSWPQTYSVGYTGSLLISPIELILALIIGFARPYDLSARWGALFLAFVSHIIIYPGHYPPGWYPAVLSLPRIIGWLIVLFVSLPVIPSIGVTFASIFPRELFKRPWIWALIWLPAVLAMPRSFFSDHTPIYSFSRWWPDWYDNLNGIFGVAGWCAIPVVLIVSYLRLRDINERRRVRIIIAGFALTLILYAPAAALYAFPKNVAVMQLVALEKDSFFLACLPLALPIATAYAILRHRLFDIRIMIRLGLRYAVARGALLSLVPIVAVVLAGDLLLHRDQPLGQILNRRGLLYAVLAGGGFLLHIRRRVWLDALDRRFFRERYDAQRILRAVVEEIREARSFEKAASLVVSQVGTALHPEFAALLVRQPGDTKYRILAARETAPPPIPADSKLMGLVRVLGKPVEVSQSQAGWLRSQLPRQEGEFLRQARIEWLFPICLIEGRTEALLAMGPKRSEEPYSREDRELLQGITGSLALFLEESPVSAAARAAFEECPQCGTCYDSGSGSCTKEGARLTPLPFSRLLAHRYRFEQRLGEGGMGTVYRALDVELERQVAVKLVRSDLTASAEATARFRQEAKAAASFTHPNVVTVHDFGVAEDHRAYLVMELLRGSTLRQEMDRQGRLPSTRAFSVLSGVCTAVTAAHRQRLLHRDLKPENILLVEAAGAELPKILDFGVVKPLTPSDMTQGSGRTGPGMLLGTLRYMSPEQLRGEKPAESWDLWALAVIAYEMLAGAHPFAADSALEVHDAVLAGRVTPLCRHLPDAPPGWQQFFDRALALRIESRPGSALQVLSEFRQWILATGAIASA